MVGVFRREDTARRHVETASADWFERDRAARELLWDIEPDGCPNDEGSFTLFLGHVLVYHS